MKKLTNHQFVERATVVHSGRYDYPDPYVRFGIKLNILCSIHGIFAQTPANHLKGQGCPQCGRIQLIQTQSKEIETFITEANMVHNHKYQYTDQYAGAHIKMDIVCPIHGIFSQTPNSHLYGNGCPICGIEQARAKRTMLFIEFVGRANQIHDNKYEYLGPYKNAHVPIEIKCSIHGLFWQSPDKHLQGHDCVQCGIGANISKPETAWLDSLGIPQEYRQASLKIDGKLIKPDALDPTTKTIYEFYGDYYHGNPHVFQSDQVNLTVKKTFSELYQATLDREQLIKQAGYKIISIWEYDWNMASKR